jgi:hypothetical protein
MSYTTARAALVAFFTGIDGIQRMYADAPWIIEGANWQLNAGTTYGAVAFIHIDQSSEARITLPAQTGQKQISYTVSLLIQYQYMIPPYLALGTSEDAWVVGLDLIVDAVKAQIRSDQKAGTGPAGVIFQQGEGTSDLRVAQDLPIADEDRVYSYTRVEFDVTEIITA